MKILGILSTCLTIIVCGACSPMIRTVATSPRTPLDRAAEVKVIGLQSAVPKDAEKLGTVKIGDSGFSINCNYEKVIGHAKNEARAIGGNALKITQHGLPSIWGSSCHRIMANILYIPDSYFSTSEDISRPDSALLAEGCAVVHIYRLGGMGAFVNYDVNVGNETITRVSDNSKESIKIKALGETTFWARTESRDELTINIEVGYHYYIRCSMKMGVMVASPLLESVDVQTGRNEYDSIHEN